MGNCFMSLKPCKGKSQGGKRVNPRPYDRPSQPLLDNNNIDAKSTFNDKDNNHPLQLLWQDKLREEEDLSYYCFEPEDLYDGLSLD